MFSKVAVILCCTLAVFVEATPLVPGYPTAGYYKPYEEQYYDAYPKYEFSYDIKDDYTGDVKSQQEERDGDNVKGVYSFIEADGTKRIVEYSADEHNGFNAIVRKEGYAAAPVYKSVPAIAPVYKSLAYPTPSAYKSAYPSYH